jgi:aminopeptidase N
MKQFLIALFLFISFGTNAQQTDIVDFTKIDAVLEPISSSGMIVGRIAVSFDILRSVDSVYLDAVNMDVYDIKKSMSVRSTENKIWLEGPFIADTSYTIQFDYQAKPRQSLYFTVDQIWTQGQGKYTSHWLPSIDDMKDKIEFDLEIVAEKSKTVIANGNLKKRIITDGGLTDYWIFDMEKPMSSYLVAFVIGDFEKLDISSNSGVPIELYYRPVDSLKAEPTYRYTKEIFDFLETEIGIPYPWQNYKQIPVRDFLYAGMENTTATILSEAFVVDSTGFTDRNYVNVNAHELAHHWFGNLVTETSGTHHWLHEGFATYYALLAEKEIFGEDYYYWKLYNTAEQLISLSDEGKGESLLNPKASSLTFYEKGAWALYILKELIGEEAFMTSVKNYLEKFKFRNVTTSDFLTEVKAVTTIDITQWEADWLQQTAFKSQQAYEFLKRSDLITRYFELQNLRKMSLADKKNPLLASSELFDNDYLGQEIIYQLADEPIGESMELYKIGFESSSIFVRQAIALSLINIPSELQTDYESLLDDNSYLTKEAALYNLWISFPDKRHGYLDEMRGIVGFQNKNVRQLWLALALFTEGYMTSAKPIFRKELRSYSSTEYSFEIRQKAFEYIDMLGLYDEQVLKDLVGACEHHNWRFRNFARNLLNDLWKTGTYKDQLQILAKELDEKTTNYLKKLLAE